MTTKKNLDTKTATKTKNEYIYDGMNGLECKAHFRLYCRCYCSYIVLSSLYYLLHINKERRWG